MTVRFPLNIPCAYTAGAMLLTLASCVHQPPPPPPEPEKKEQPQQLFEWNGKGRTVSHIKIDVDEQKARYYSGGEEIGWSYVASGLRSFPTPVGSYKVIEKTADKKSNLYGKIYNSSGKLVNSDAKMGRDSIPEGGKFTGATMSYYMRLTGDGIGMHAGPIPRPGNRASHGCIRLPRSFAPLLFASTPMGTPVNISGDGPSYASYMKAQNAAAAKLAAARAKKKAAAAATAVTSTDTPPAPGAITTPSAPVSADSTNVEIKPAVIPTTTETPPAPVTPAATPTTPGN
jgi:hypothetical protein